MADLKPIWSNIPAPTPGLEGDSVLSRGSDPNADLSGSSALQDFWGNQPVSDPDGQETANPVSGLPLRPNRWEPSDNPPGPPDLTDRNPGTIDEQ